ASAAPRLRTLTEGIELETQRLAQRPVLVARLVEGRAVGGARLGGLLLQDQNVAPRGREQRLEGGIGLRVEDLERLVRRAVVDQHVGEAQARDVAQLRAARAPSSGRPPGSALSPT